MKTALDAYKAKGLQNITLTDSEKVILDKVVKSPISLTVKMEDLLQNIYDELEKMDNKPFADATIENNYTDLLNLLNSKDVAWKLSEFTNTSEIKRKIYVKSKIVISPEHITSFEAVLGKGKVPSTRLFV